MRASRGEAKVAAEAKAWTRKKLGKATDVIWAAPKMLYQMFSIINLLSLLVNTYVSMTMTLSKS